MTNDVSAKILVVEDDEELRSLLLEEIRDRGLLARGTPSAEGARDLLEAWPADVVVTDIRLPGASGQDLLRWGTAVRDGPDFLLITAFGTVRQAVECLHAGASDFLTKPLDLDHLAVALERILEMRRLRSRVAALSQLVGEAQFHGLVGRSEPMRRLFADIARVATASGPVLVVGESGTGKELVARAIHAEGRGESDPFVAVNCAGVPADLMESEFFGHTQGAFTGANRERRGLFDAAHGGTLMLDEVGAMPPTLQSKLLRVLEGGRVRSVGTNRERVVEVRIIAATNRDLREDVEGGHFREDLYYRLEAFTVSVPPLRERRDDVDLLLAHFLGLFSARAEKRVVGFSPGAMLRLKRYSYPGNVRELRNIVERAVAYASGERIHEEDLPERVRSGDGGGSTVLDVPPQVLEAGDGVLPTLRDVEGRYIRYVLEHVDGNKRRAAALLGIARRTLYRRLSGDGE